MNGTRADLYPASALLLAIGILAIAYKSWIGHALVGLAGLVLVVTTVSAGAMLTGRIQTGRINALPVHRRAGLFLFTLVLGTFLYGLRIKMLHGEPLLRSWHGWLGLIILLMVAVQVLPSLTGKRRSKGSHRLLGYALAPLLMIESALGLYMGVVAGTKNLVLTHSITGGMAALALAWLWVEMRYPTKRGVARARLASYLASLFLVAGCWIGGGYYYRTSYGTETRPLILAGSSPWAHQIVMETKEHIFIFLPVIALAISLTLASTDAESLLKSPDSRRALAMISGFAVLMILITFLMGALISNAGRMGGLS